MLRAASVGLGWWSDELAGAIHGKSDSIRIVAGCARTPEKRAAFAKKFGVAERETYAAVLADPAIDAVILTTPHSLHARHVIEAARAGKHVFVEKPFTMSAESGREAAAACAAAGVVLAVGHNRRFAPAAIAIKRMLDAGEFGIPLHGEGNFSAATGLAYTPDIWRASRTETPAGGVAGLGVHMIDALTWFFGRAVKVMAQATRRAIPVDLEDTTSALYVFESGATGYIGTMMTAPYTSLLNVFGTKINAFAQLDGNQLTVLRADGTRLEEPIEPVDTLKAELEEFAAACAGQVEFRVRPEEAIHVVEVMEAMVASAAAGGQAVEIGPA